MSGKDALTDKVITDKRICEIYPQIRLGVLRFRANIKKSDEQFWTYMDNEILPGIKNSIEGKEWNEIPGVRGSRAAYKAFGRNPGRYRVSSGALLRRVRRGDELYHINSAVDVNNLILVQRGLSVGSYDLDRVSGTIVLRKAEQGKSYTGIGKDFLDLENMLVLSDDNGIFGCSMSDSTRAMVTEQTKDVLVVIYCFEDEIELQKLVTDAEQVFARFSECKNFETAII